MGKANLRTTSFRMSPEGRELLKRLADHLGISQAAVIEILIRDRAKVEGLLFSRLAAGEQRLQWALSCSQRAPGLEQAFIDFKSPADKRRAGVAGVVVRPMNDGRLSVAWYDIEDEKEENGHGQTLSDTEAVIRFVESKGWPVDRWTPMDQ